MRKIEKGFQIGTPTQRGRRRYLCGIATGLKRDAHGEHMSGNCIRSIIRQARERDILLYPDEHGIRESEDIGILRRMRQLPNGDIYVEFRLYDESDGVDMRSVETANKLWAQANGLAPYTRPREKGFSIEGYIPEDRQDLEEKRDKEGIIDDMRVEGFVVVPEPAYENSVIQTVEKSKKHITKEVRMSKVQKTLTPKEEDLIQQIEEAIAELRKATQAGDGELDEILEADDEGEPLEEEPAEEEVDIAVEDEFKDDDVEKGEEGTLDSEPEAEEEEAAKSKVKKSESGRAGAEEKVNTLAPEDERALAVLKGLFGGVRKSGRIPEATVKYFGATHKIMKSMLGRLRAQNTRLERQSQRIAELEGAVSGVLEGIGISEKVLGATSVQRVRKSKLSPDAEAIVSALGGLIQKSARAPRDEPYGGRAESLGDVLGSIFGER